MDRTEKEIYTDLVYWCADNAPDGWNKVCINFEIAFKGNEVANSWVIRCYKGLLNKKVELEAPALIRIDMSNLFIELNDLCAKKDQRWSICDFVVFSDGKYKADFSYDRPPRLSGDLTSGTE